MKVKRIYVVYCITKTQIQFSDIVSNIVSSKTYEFAVTDIVKAIDYKNEMNKLMKKQGMSDVKEYDYFTTELIEEEERES